MVQCWALYVKEIKNIKSEGIFDLVLVTSDIFNEEVKGESNNWIKKINEEYFFISDILFN